MKSFIEEWNYVARSRFWIVIFVAPLVAALFFGLMFSKNQINESPIVIVDEDHSSYSRQIISKINASQYMKVTNVYSNHMNPDVLLANEQAVAVIMIPDQFELRKAQGSSVNIGVFLDNTMPSSLSGIRTAIQEIITTENITLSTTALLQKGMEAEAVKGIVTPINLVQRMLYNPTTSFMGTMVIGFVNIVMLMILTGAAGAVVPRLRKEGKLLADGISSMHLWLRATPYAILGAVSLLLSYGLLKQIGGLRFEAGPFEIIIPLLLYSFALSMLAMLLGYSVRDISKVGSRMSLILYPSFLATGIQLTPLALPKFFQITAWALPMNWLNRIIRGMGFRQGSLSYYSLEMGALMIIIGVAALWIGILLLREAKKENGVLVQSIEDSGALSLSN